jgi:tetratricopeptide (TPR) repeat protein
VLKGIGEPVQATTVLGVHDEEEDDGGEDHASAPVLVGRDEEIGLLRRAWQQSKEGLGQAVLLNGEPGIGKSALVETLRAQLRDEGAPRIVLRCSAYHTNSPLHPIVEHVRRLMDWQSGDSPEVHQAKLERMLDGYSQSKAEVVPVIASFLSVPLPEGQYPPLDLGPEELKQEVLDILVAWILEEAESRPTLMVFEDLHWADPSTLELLSVLVDQAPTSSLLLVLTHRPDFEPPWRTRSHMTPITLARLERPQIELMVKRLAQAKKLPSEVTEYVVHKTDGVPLYVEELTKALMASEVLRETADQYELTGPLSSVAIPATLQESLMARLDQLPTVREVAQLGAVLGREFAYELLQALGLIEEPALRDGLSQLVAEELLYQRGRPPRAKYMFKHALIQDAAYQSLLRRTRQQYHYQVARLLEERFPKQVETEPEILAFHYTGAGRTVEAIDYWRRASKRAVEQYANVEAIAHLSKGLELLQELPDGAERAGQELPLRIELVACMRILDRYDEALETLDRAQAIATDLGAIEDLALIHNYRGNIYFPLGEFEKCLEHHQLAADYARQSGAVEQEAQALSGLGDAHYTQGQMIKSLDHFQRCVDFCRQHALHRIEAKNSPLVAWLRQYLNDFAGAAKEGVVAIDAALTFGDRRAEVLARVAVASALSELGDIAGARTQIEAGLAVVETTGTLRFKPLFAILRNRVDLAEGKSRPQLAAAMEEAFQTARETGIKFLGPWVLSSLALVSDDPERRRQALADGEELLGAGCVGHTYLAFYPDAIEMALGDAAWDEVERYATALADYTRSDPLPFTDFYIAYGRTLAAFGRGARDKATIDEIERLKNEAITAGLTRSFPQLDEALAESSVATGSPA